MPLLTGTTLPTTLAGVSVTIDGKAAYMYYVSSGQLNVLAPADSNTGSAMVQVMNSMGTSAPVPVTRQALAPVFFAFSAAGR